MGFSAEPPPLPVEALTAPSDPQVRPRLDLAHRQLDWAETKKLAKENLSGELLHRRHGKPDVPGERDPLDRGTAPIRHGITI